MPILPKQTVQQLPAWPSPSADRLKRIRLDAGEHPEGFPSYYPYDLDPVRVSTYPQYGELLAKLADLYGVGPENIILSNGSDNGLALIAQTFIEPGKDHAICNTPSFVVIPHSLKLAGAWLHQIPVANDLSCDTAQVDVQLREQHIKLVMVASPDNPTGMLISPDAIEDWCGEFKETLFVVDEAYYEYTGQTVLPMVRRFDNLIVTRTFSKAWGMAGLRVGVLIANAELIDYLSRVRPLFDVNSVGAETALRMIDHHHEVIAVARDIMAEKARLIKRLSQVVPSEIHSGHANFVLIDMSENARAFVAFCESQNVLVRMCAPTAIPADVLYGRIRVSVGTPEQNDFFADVVSRFCAEVATRLD